MEKQKWCMCTELESVARDTYSTCSICGGMDAYGGSSMRSGRFMKKCLLQNPPSEKHKPIPQKKWMDGYKDEKLLYVNYQYHKDVCAVSLKRFKEIESLQTQLNESIADANHQRQSCVQAESEFRALKAEAEKAAKTMQKDAKATQKAGLRIGELEGDKGTLKRTFTNWLHSLHSSISLGATQKDNLDKIEMLLGSSVLTPEPPKDTK